MRIARLTSSTKLFLFTIVLFKTFLNSNPDSRSAAAFDVLNIVSPKQSGLCLVEYTHYIINQRPIIVNTNCILIS